MCPLVVPIEVNLGTLWACEGIIVYNINQTLPTLFLQWKSTYIRTEYGGEEVIGIGSTVVPEYANLVSLLGF